MRQIVVQIGKGDPVLGSNWLPDDDFVYVVEFVPIFIAKTNKKSKFTFGIKLKKHKILTTKFPFVHCLSRLNFVYTKPRQN